MRATGWLRSHLVEAAWVVFAAANVAVMVAWPSWETIPFHFVWISLTLLYGFRVWGARVTSIILAAVVAATGTSILFDAFEGIQLWGELFEVPLMAAMFLAMVWHARRRQAAMRATEELVLRQERFLHDVSHELRTPVTIARGHLDLHRRQEGDSPELAVAVDELARIERMISRLLLLAEAGQPQFLAPVAVEADSFLEEVFIRWTEVAPRAWRLGRLVTGRVHADEEALRVALDALLENAVKYTEPHDAIEVSSRVLDFGLVIEVADTGSGIPPDAVDRIFERFARGDVARSRTTGGVGLGLAIVDAVAKAHGGSCTVSPREQGTVFSLRLPSFQQSAEREAPPTLDPVPT
ncbi:MAG TPA: HAMP domain-containing sensor histidine kinase [Gaiellaceae bacterium]|jgi:signal transduction histidine kinase